MPGAGMLFLVSTGLFITLAALFSYEERTGRRVVLARVRDVLDEVVVRVVAYVQQKIHYVVRHAIKLSWYYSIHSALRAVMTVLVRTYDSLEAIFMKNRERARILRAEKKSQVQKSHLEVIGEHKTSTALTPAQKKKLRAKKLERE